LPEKDKFFLESILEGDRLAISRAITYIENEKDNYEDLLSNLHYKTGKAYRIGITGPPGVGKSTLTNHLAKQIRGLKAKVGIIAVDPTSPFTGGAILGDRVRMQELTLDEGIYIRSMATRGNLGGLARRTSEVADVLDAAGYEYIIYETVGVGQVELDIAQAADTTLVMVVPESGDAIQGMKSGLMEIGEIFVLNKSDRPGAALMQKDLEYVLHLRETKTEWYPKVILTVANRALGIKNVWDEICSHKSFLDSKQRLQKKRDSRMKGRIKILVREKIEQDFWNKERKIILSNYLKVKNQKISPYQIVDNLLAQLLQSIDKD
jgi:LAO/AO transport system kinase